MLKKLGLNCRLHELTVLLAVSAVIILNGCALKGQTSKTFYPEYYAAKRLQNQDIVKLRELTVHPDLFRSEEHTSELQSQR